MPSSVEVSSIKLYSCVFTCRGWEGWNDEDGWERTFITKRKPSIRQTLSIFTKSSPTSSHRSDEVGSNRIREANIGTEIRSKQEFPTLKIISNIMEFYSCNILKKKKEKISIQNSYKQLPLGFSRVEFSVWTSVAPVLSHLKIRSATKL